jgi:hypothetical protein
MKLRKFSLIYLILNIAFATPAVIDKMGIINIYRIRIPPMVLVYYLPALIYYIYFLTYINVVFFVILTAFNIRDSIKEKKANTLFYVIYTVSLVIAIFLNIYWGINGMQILTV